MRKTILLLTLLLSLVSFKALAADVKNATLTLTQENMASRDALSGALEEALATADEKETDGEDASDEGTPEQKEYNYNLILTFDDESNELSNDAQTWLKDLLIANANITGVDMSAIGIYPILHDNKSVTSVKLPDTTGNDIPTNMFNGCGALTNLTIGEWSNTAENANSCAVNNIGNDAFRFCKNLNNLNFVVSGTIGNDVFRKCDALTTIPVKPAEDNNALKFGSYAFGECANLTEVTIPDGVVEVGENAFNGCENLKKITLANSVTAITYNCIENCTAFEGFYVQEGNTNFSAKDGIIYSADKSKIVLCPWTKQLANATFTETVIHENAFRDCKYIGALSFPNLQTLGENVFRGSSIKSLTLPPAANISKNNFVYECAELTEIKTTEGDGNLKALDGILYMKVGENYTLFACPAKIAVKDEAINILPTGRYNKETQEIEVKESLGTNVLDLFYVGKDNLGGDVTTVAEGAFYQNTSIETLVLPDNVSTISDQAFNTCKFKYLAVPYNLASYGVAIMVLCHDFTAYVVDKRSKDITNGDDSVNKDNWLTIGDITYYPLKKFSVGSLGVLYDINHEVMYSVPAQYVPANEEGSLRTYDNIRRIHSCCFRNTKNIKKVFLSQGIMVIPHQCFFNSDIEELTIPNSVVQFGQDMFQGANKLKDVYFLTTSTRVPMSQNSNYNIFWAYNPPAGTMFHFSKGYDGLIEAYKAAEDKSGNGFKTLANKTNITFVADIEHRALFESEDDIAGFKNAEEINGLNKFENEAPKDYDMTWIRDAANAKNSLSSDTEYKYITLYRDFSSTKDDEFNTLVLPFSITRKQMREKFEMLGNAAKVYKFVGRVNNTIRFTTVNLHAEEGKDDDIIAEAGEALLIKPTRKRHSYLFELDGNNKFTAINDDNTTSETLSIVVETKGNTTRTESGEAITDVTFKHGFYGTFRPNQMVGPCFYYVTADGNVKYATTKRNITKAFRGYILGNEYGYKEETLTAAKALIDIDGVATGLDEINIDGITTNKLANIYSIDGRLIRQNTSSTDGLPKGMYIVNGKKVIVK